MNAVRTGVFYPLFVKSGYRNGDSQVRRLQIIVLLSSSARHQTDGWPAYLRCKRKDR